MSNTTKVQSYLTRYKIASLFEGLMAKLVKDMPADPLGYLSTLIQEKKEKTRRGSPPGADAGTDHSTSVWTADTKDYEKPWKAHSKKPSQKASESASKKDWDKTVKLSNKSFDEISPTQKPAKSQKHDLFDSKTKGNSNCSVTEEELLAGELLPQSMKTGEDKSLSKPTEAIKHHPKLKGPKADAAKHSQELKAFVKEKRAQAEKADSGVGSVVSDDEEPTGARVMAENSSDLAAEGVKVTSTNAGSIQVRKDTCSADAMIHLAICSRCAKVLVKNGDDASSVSGSSTSSASTLHSTKEPKYKQAQNSVRSDQWATHRTGSKASPVKNPTVSARAKAAGAKASAGRAPGYDMSQRTASKERQLGGKGLDNVISTQRTGYSSFYDDDDDDEFESVSQISGDNMRVPMWTNSDDEDLSPVKGSHMLSSPRQAKPSSAGSQRKAVTLKEDVLRSLPVAGNQVEQFIGASRTWSGEKPERVQDLSRRSHDSFSPAHKSRDQPTVYKSYDALTSKKSAGWKFEENSDDDSAVM